MQRPIKDWQEDWGRGEGVAWGGGGGATTRLQHGSDVVLEAHLVPTVTEDQDTIGTIILPGTPPGMVHF